MLIAAGYTPEFVRWGMTLNDFQMAVLCVIKDQIELQKAHTMAVSMAVAMAFDGKVGEKIMASTQQLLADIDTQQALIYDVAPEASVDKPKDSSGLDQKMVKTWRQAQEIDSLFSKLTGKMSGAPWAGISRGTQEEGMDYHSGLAQSLTGKQIVATVKRGVDNDLARGVVPRGIRPGRR